MSTIASGSVRSLTCPNCGAAIVLRGMAWTQVVTCASCSAVLDARDENLRVLREFSQGAHSEPEIPLGSRGQWRGAQYEVIGYQEVSITVESTRYAWREYLLFNPYHGFRYLTEYNNHWNDVVSVRGVPRVVQTSHPTATHQGRTFKHFQTATATTDYILGEFPWEVRVGDQVTACDYVDPPYVLSSEATDGEVNWSLGEYVDSAEIWRAFKLEGAPRAKWGVYANQPNPRAATGGVWKLFGIFAAVLLVLMIARLAMADRRVVHTGDYVFDRQGDSASALVTPSFDLGGGTANVGVDVHTNLVNSWAFLTYTLIEEDTGDAYDFGKEVSYYSGVDSDGFWSEGSLNAHARVAGIPAGRYFMRVEAQRPADAQPLNVSMTVRRDLPSFVPYLLALGLLFLPPLFLAIMRGSFEAQRWAESDYAPDTSSDDDDE